MVSDFNEKNWERRHFAFFDNERVYAWVSGTTSWSTDNDKEAMSWKYAKLAEV